MCAIREGAVIGAEEARAGFADVDALDPRYDDDAFLWYVTCSHETASDAVRCGHGAVVVGRVQRYAPFGEADEAGGELLENLPADIGCRQNDLVELQIRHLAAPR